MTKIPLTVVVVTKNEEANIVSCLGSVKDWADEIVMVDDESIDRTIPMAKAYTDRIFSRKMENEGRHRNWAYAQAKNEWVLSLDADEMVTEELKQEIRQTLSNGAADAYAIPLRNYIGNYWVKHSGWYPASKVRLFKKSRFRYEEVEVHPRIFVEGTTSQLTKDIIHKGYPDFEHFLASLNRQTTLEARKWFNSGKSISRGFAARRTVDRFFRSYIGKKGYRDGFIGFMIALFGAFYQVVSYAKYRQMKEELSGDSCQSTEK